LTVHSLTISLVVLALLVTSEEHRRKGAGSSLLQWGTERSGQSRILYYLQASVQGRQLYEKYGFQAVDTLELDLDEYGLEGREEMTEMIRQPSDI
jgi:GNAT superfamily N-acetyltransferase